ncbi:MAG: hypothetical protein JW764_09365, partial [Chlorobiaceae bacterium]|nr:hypothetical protein [Chlorobiaceae bacterium]
MAAKKDCWTGCIAAVVLIAEDCPNVRREAQPYNAAGAECGMNALLIRQQKIAIFSKRRDWAKALISFFLSI